jgi:tetratricopeptide (TPR) repeat protein/DNA-binding CsgD family transcriptional regulator
MINRSMMNLRLMILLVLLVFLSGCHQEEAKTENQNTLRETVIKLIDRADEFLAINSDSSIWFAQQAVNLSQQLRNEQTIHALILLSKAHYNRGELYESLKYLISTHELAIAEGITATLPDIVNMQGNIYGSLGQYDKATEYYLQVLKMLENSDQKNELARAYNNLGLIYYRMGQVKKAEIYHKHAFGIWEEEGNERGLASSYTNLAYIYAYKGAYEQALDYFRKAQEIYEARKNVRRYANTFINIGAVYVDMGNYSKALELFDRSLPLSKKGHFNDIYADGLNKKGWALYKLKRYQEAIKTLEEGMDIAVGIKDPSLINELNLRLTEVYAGMGDYRIALSYFKKWSEIKDSIFRDKRAEYISLFEVMYKTEAKERRIRVLEEVNKRKEWILWSSLVLAFLLVVVIILLSNRYRMRLRYHDQQRKLEEQTLQGKQLEIALEKSRNEQLEAENRLQEEENQRLQMEIQHRHSELSSVTLHLYQKNESLSHISREVEKLLETTSDGSRQTLRGIRQLINKNLNLDEDWNQFRIYFDQVHHGFIERLKKQYPGLTTNDLRHCSFIRMNLSTSEISNLMHISPESVQKSRVRLKKKLNLSKSEDLYEYIIRY